jgi:hypothetical protein
VKTLCILLTCLMPVVVLAQPAPEWEVLWNQGCTYQGWVALSENPIEVRYATVDTNAAFGIKIMDGVYSTTAAVTIPYTAQEFISDNLNNFDEMVRCDFSGDGKNDLEIRRIYQDNREGFRIVNSMSGETIYEFDNAAFYYVDLWSYNMYPQNAPDVDNDGNNELIVYRADFPSGGNGRFDVYHTNGMSSAVKGSAIKHPGSFALFQNFPNPFNPSTVITYELSKPGSTQIEIYDTAGRVVRAFASQHEGAGPHKLTWDGKDNSGLQAASGIYFYRLTMDGRQTSRKMIVLK